MKNFDSVFTPAAPSGTGTTAPAPSPQPEDAERDLGVANPDPVGPQLMEPPSLTEEAFKQKYSSSASTNVTINVGGCNLTATLVDNKLYFSTATKMKRLGASTPNAKPVLLYAGGSWISEDSKDWCSNICSFVKRHMCIYMYSYIWLLYSLAGT